MEQLLEQVAKHADCIIAFAGLPLAIVIFFIVVVLVETPKSHNHLSNVRRGVKLQ